MLELKNILDWRYNDINSTKKLIESLENHSNYEFLNTFTFQNKDECRLCPIILLPYVDAFDGSVNIIYNNASQIRLRQFSRLQFSSRFFNNYSACMIEGCSFGLEGNTVQYKIGRGIIMDMSNNIIFCFCTNLAEVDYNKKAVDKKNVFLIVDYNKLSLPENKKLFTLYNNYIFKPNYPEVEVIFTTDINKKIFHSFERKFKSLAERKRYYEELANKFKSENIIEEEKVVTPKFRRKKIDETCLVEIEDEITGF